ncbi:hypothetical protein ZIOFF_063821 [Zingiber officinale]|uniref:EF-hand domain-containing protein n=1 Tax=Zingiber officinale TaxID=94328 RepID=A0A8J5F2X7_ZINOF|nr:hypothetical protein ZIOFF_063821 [Zingiber officinale]
METKANDYKEKGALSLQRRRQCRYRGEDIGIAADKTTSLQRRKHEHCRGEDSDVVAEEKLQLYPPIEFLSLLNLILYGDHFASMVACVYTRRARPEPDLCPLLAAPDAPHHFDIDLPIALRKEVPTSYPEAYQHSAAWRTIMNEEMSTLISRDYNHMFSGICLSLPKISKEDFELIFEELDDSGDFKINLEEFTDLCNAIALRFQREAVPSWFENYPTFYRSRPCEMLKAFVRSTTFANIVGFVLIINLVAVVIETTLDIQNSSAQKFWQEIEFFFGWIYVLEMALKIFSFGFDAYWMDGQNQFDFVITWTIVIGETLTFASPSTFPFLLNGECRRSPYRHRTAEAWNLGIAMNMARALEEAVLPSRRGPLCTNCGWTTTNLNTSSGGPPLAKTKTTGDISKETPPASFFKCPTRAEMAEWRAKGLCFNCDESYSMGHKCKKHALTTNSRHQGVFHVQVSYLLFNFNDYPNGMVTLFNLLVMGNWQVWMQSYSELTGTYWTLIYFISFYLITVLLLLNLVVAFILEAFFAEMDLESANEPNEDAPERKGRRRLTGASSRNRTVDILLHRILSAELEESQNAEA